MGQIWRDVLEGRYQAVITLDVDRAEAWAAFVVVHMDVKYAKFF